MIPQSFIQDLLARVDIVDVVGRHVRLRKAGANFLGLCPFHGEKSPSFTVSATKQFYHCFGCGAHGSAIGFLMEQAGMSYVDAIHELARGLGLTVPQERGGPQAPRVDPGLIDTLESAARFYKSRLKDSTKAIEYLKGRGVSGKTAADFAIGYAPEGWQGLQAAVPDYFAPTLLEAGLVIEPEPQDAADASEVKRRRYDRFRDRIMFPIRSTRGQVIGFGGRVLGKGEPKYLNSPETPVFSKGRELYGLFEGRDAIRASGFVIVVEGYMDVVMLAQHGVRNAVATLGTATTAQHVQKLLRTVDRVVFAFDGDAAGRRAAWRALESSLPHVADTKRLEFLFLPAEHDPDSLIRAEGAEGFARHLAGALPLSEFMLRELASRVDLGSPEGRARFQADARPLLLALPPVALRLQLIQVVADRAGVRHEDMLDFLKAGEAAQARPEARPALRTAPAQPDADEGDWPGPPPEWSDESAPSARDDWQPGGGRGNSGNWDRKRNSNWSSSGNPGGNSYGSSYGNPNRDGKWSPRSGAEGRWGGRGGPQDRWGAGREVWRRPAPAAQPDLLRRARLLLALHRSLAVQDWSTDFLPDSLIGWMTRLGGVPTDMGFQALVDSLRADEPVLAEELETEARLDRGLMAGLGEDEARSEFAGALDRLRVQQIKEDIDRLAAGGLGDDASRARYVALQGLLQTFSAQGN